MLVFSSGHMKANGVLIFFCSNEMNLSKKKWLSFSSSWTGLYVYKQRLIYCLDVLPWSLDDAMLPTIIFSQSGLL